MHLLKDKSIRKSMCKNVALFYSKHEWCVTVDRLQFYFKYPQTLVEKFIIYIIYILYI